MFTACWSVKGGSGTTTVATGLALAAAAGSPTLLVDLKGDAAAALGSPAPPGPGLGDWCRAHPDVAADGLARLERSVADNLALLEPGSQSTGACASAAAELLVGMLASDRRTVVADCGVADSTVSTAMAAGAGRSVLVLAPCYLSLRRATAIPLRPSGIVIVRAPWHAISDTEVGELLGVPVLARVPVDPSIGRAVDAGLLAVGAPRLLRRATHALS